jgi:hypothetical protein
MPRVIGVNVTNEVEIKDAVTGELVTLYYRSPKTKERVDYQAKAFKVSGKGRKAKLQSNVVEMRQFFGSKILTGVQEGYFIFRDENGDEKPLDSTVPGFQNILLEYAPEILEALAFHVFEGTFAVANEDDSEAEDDGDDGQESEEEGELGEA